MTESVLSPGVPPASLAAESAADATVIAGQWRLIWRKFRKHRLALIGGILTILNYLVALFAEFLAPFTTERYSADYTYALPQRLHLFAQTEDRLRFAPYVNGYTVELNYDQRRRIFVTDPTVRHPVSFFARGEPYRLLGLIESDIHLIGPDDPDAPMYLIGAERLGRDIFSRTIYGTRVSMTIGLVGVALSLLLGLLLGGISGYFGGWIDNVIQR